MGVVSSYVWRQGDLKLILKLTEEEEDDGFFQVTDSRKWPIILHSRRRRRKNPIGSSPLRLCGWDSPSQLFPSKKLDNRLSCADYIVTPLLTNVCEMMSSAAL